MRRRRIDDADVQHRAMFLIFAALMLGAVLIARSPY